VTMRTPKTSGTSVQELLRVDFSRVQQSRGYDWVMRFPMLGWSLLCAMLQMAGLFRYLREADPALTHAVYAINIAMRLSTIAFLLLLAAAVILRTRPTGKARGIEPRMSAFIGTSLIYALPLFPRHELTLPAEMVSTLLILLGSSAAVIALLQLGRSFSMMAEARHLVTAGPYRFVRHPLYLAEELAVIGIFMQYLSVWTTLILVVQIAFQLRRMHNEEAVLSETFPEYAAYRDKTARLIPSIY
jgi:protein-S-isoprenylcysteine O-methyltransferase Ste14